MAASNPSLRAIPSVEKTLQDLGRVGLPRALVVAVVRGQLARARRRGKVVEAPELLAGIRRELTGLARARIQPVINGTGTVIHTNLGRAPLGATVVEAVAAAAAQYHNLEYDLTTGQRGGRAGYLERTLALLCGAPAATVVNNCAAALLLTLRHLTAGERKEVVISRGELVQIGGGFRIPEILEASGARLREVGTTNRTTASDYARAIGRSTALLLKVHRSNFFMGGFVESPATAELAVLARRKRIPLVEDLGSGAVMDTAQWAGLDREPTPADVLRAGVDLVCFSGDKLLGAPQAGIVAGRARWVEALKREPFFRALRCDKLVLAGLQATVDLYLDGAGAKGTNAVPRVVELLALTPGDLQHRAEALAASLSGLPMEVRIGQGQGQVGGGTLPAGMLPSVTLELRPHGLRVAELAERLRQGAPPVVGYVAGDRFKIDLRTVFPDQDGPLAAVVRAALFQTGSPR